MDVVPSWTKTHQYDEIGGTYAIKANMPNVPMRRIDGMDPDREREGSWCCLISEILLETYAP